MDVVKAVQAALDERDRLIADQRQHILKLRCALQQIIGYTMSSWHGWGKWRAVIRNYANDVL